MLWVGLSVFCDEQAQRDEKRRDPRLRGGALSALSWGRALVLLKARLQSGPAESLFSSPGLQRSSPVLFIMCETRHTFSVINLTYQRAQEGSPSCPVGFNKQDYAGLRDACLHSGRLFVDSTFPPNSQSLGDLPDLSSWREAQVQWLRPQVTVIHGSCKFDQ